MRIEVRVKPNAKKREVTLLEDGTYVVSVSAPPVEGKANEQLVEVLAEYFHKRKREVVILRGTTGRRKLVDIL